MRLGYSRNSRNTVLEACAWVRLLRMLLRDMFDLPELKADLHLGLFVCATVAQPYRIQRLPIIAASYHREPRSGRKVRRLHSLPGPEVMETDAANGAVHFHRPERQRVRASGMTFFAKRDIDGTESGSDNAVLIDDPPRQSRVCPAQFLPEEVKSLLVEQRRPTALDDAPRAGCVKKKRLQRDALLAHRFKCETCDEAFDFPVGQAGNSVAACGAPAGALLKCSIAVPASRLAGAAGDLCAYIPNGRGLRRHGWARACSANQEHRYGREPNGR